ncbi:MAG: glycosyltransferase family 4 protein [Acidihalobacter sp.]
MITPRIALIRQKYTSFGGAERFAAAALDALVESGARLSVVTRHWRHQPGVEAVKVNPFHIGRLWRDRGFAKAACAVVEERGFDLVQSHERLPCCDVYRAGDGVHREWLRQRGRTLSFLGRVAQALSPYHRHVRSAERRLFASPRLRAVICNSEMVRQEILEHFGPKNARLEVIYNAVDLDRFSPLLRSRFRQTLLAELAIPERSLVYLFVGSGYARKGLARALRALKRLPLHCYLVVVGKDRHTRRYERLARRLGIAARVRFAGAQEDTAPYYGAADAFVLPTLYDPFPNVVLEAMASGLPVVTSRKCGAVDLIRDGENGYVCDALDEEGLAWRMRELLDHGTRERLGYASRKLVEGWTSEQMAERMLALYRDLLDKAD